MKLEFTFLIHALGFIVHSSSEHVMPKPKMLARILQWNLITCSASDLLFFSAESFLFSIVLHSEIFLIMEAKWVLNVFHVGFQLELMDQFVHFYLLWSVFFFFPREVLYWLVVSLSNLFPIYLLVHVFVFVSLLHLSTVSERRALDVGWEGLARGLTSSELSRQLSCPSHLRLADTQPPLAHTYSFREQEGSTAKQMMVKNPPSHIDTYTTDTGRVCQWVSCVTKFT